MAKPAADRIRLEAGNQRFIAFQTPIDVTGYVGNTAMIPRTFEEAFIYTNLPAVRANLLKTFTPLPVALDYEADYESIYNAVKSKGYKKVEFALEQIASSHKWRTPAYICDGLEWLNKVVAPLTLGTLVEGQTP